MVIEDKRACSPPWAERHNGLSLVLLREAALPSFKIRYPARRATRQDGTLRFGSSDLNIIPYVMSVTTAVRRSLAANLVPLPGVPYSALAPPDVRENRLSLGA